LGVGLSKIERARLPLHQEQVDALAELREGSGLLLGIAVEAFAEAVHEAAALPVDLPCPKLLYPGSEVPLLRVPDLNCLACLAGGIVQYRPVRQRKRQGFIWAHELGEAILDASRFAHNHVDVQRVALGIMVPRSIAMPLIDRVGAARAASILVRRARWAPAWVVRTRVEILVNALRVAA
jgi:hypothetical protein